MTFPERHRLARYGPDDLPRLGPEESAVVIGLARARVRTAWRLFAAAAVLGWLATMTVSGFGLSTFGDDADGWHAAGIAIGVVVWLIATVAAARRTRRAQRLLAATDDTAE